MNDQTDPRVPWQPVVAEFVGTALLVLVGLSVVIFMFGRAARWRESCRAKERGG
jgi:glycerol uptake facilitator-like aquaporin